MQMANLLISASQYTSPLMSYNQTNSLKAETKKGEIQVLDDERDSKKKTFRVRKACIRCQKSHVSCEETRPCKRCSDRRILCEDYTPKRRGRKRQYNDDLQNSPSNTEVGLAVTSGTSPSSNPSSPSTSSPHSLIPTSAPVYYSENSILDLPPDLFSDLFFGGDFEISELQSVPTEQDCFSNFTTFLRSRLPEGSADMVIGKMYQNRSLIQDIIARDFKNFVGKSPCAIFKKEIGNHVKVLTEMISNLAVPTIIFEKIGIIHYANPAFVRMFNFKDPLPTAKEDYSWFKILSRESTRTYLLELSQYMLIPSKNDIIFSASLLNFNIPEESYIHGTICLTVKRDPIGLPICMAASFLPHL